MYLVYLRCDTDKVSHDPDCSRNLKSIDLNHSVIVNTSVSGERRNDQDMSFKNDSVGQKKKKVGLR